ncbi:sugar phosphate isomerase/epimerase family protein [Eisenbergiella sp.]
MQIGCTLLSPQDLDAVKETGFDYAEFMGKYLVSLSSSEYLELQRAVKRSRLQVAGMNGYCPETVKIAGPGFEPEVIRKYACQCAQKAGGLGIRFAGIGSPRSRNLPKGYSRLTAVHQLKEFLKITAEEFEKYDIIVCLEPLAPCYCNFINSIPEAVSVAEELNLPNVGLVVDFYNMEYVNEADLNLKKYKGIIKHAHISDDDGTSSQRSYLKPEKEEIHRNRIRRLYETGYQGAISLEIDCRIDAVRAARSLEIMKSAKGR